MTSAKKKRNIEEMMLKDFLFIKAPKYYQRYHQASLDEILIKAGSHIFSDGCSFLILRFSLQNHHFNFLPFL